MSAHQRNIPLTAVAILCLAGALLAGAGPARAANEKPLSAVETLGKQIFEDHSLSSPPGQACSSCHQPSLAFSHPATVAVPMAMGAAAGHSGVRNVPALMYTKFTPPFSFVGEKNEKGEMEYTPTGGWFLDGRANSLAEQAIGPLLNRDEMNNPDLASVATKLRAAPYIATLQNLMGVADMADDAQLIAGMQAAIAAYESSDEVSPFTSRFDKYLQGKVQLTDQELQGFALFKDETKGNCIACHAGDVNSKRPEDWLFTDFTYDNLGVPRNPHIPANAKAETYDLGLCARAGLEGLLPDGVKKDSLCGAFKVPTLRNIALTAPYFHNGQIGSLKEAVTFYVTRETAPEKWYPEGADHQPLKYNDLPLAMAENINTSEAPYDRKAGEQPRLNEQEIDALVAFLQCLTDENLITAK